MKIKSIKIHNFRSIIDSPEIILNNFSLLVGANNVGKSNLIDVLRILYDHEKFDSKRDFPKASLKPTDNESWIDVKYSLSDEEHKNLPDYSKQFTNELRIRKYFKSDNPEQFKSGQSNIFAYEKEGVISKNLFHGAKNVSEAKLGRIIFIPSVNKTEDILKTSGPSPLRQIATFVFEKVAKKSPAFNNLETAFSSFESDFSIESSPDGFSIKDLITDVNKHLEEWQISFGITIKKIRVDDIIKNLFEHNWKDDNLGGESIDINQYGQGFQRHIIYTLIKLSAKYVDKRTSSKKEFIPEFVLILFEEPEAFLHPAQQEILHAGLKEITSDEEEQTQVLISTHSPIFVSRNIDDLTSVIRLQKEKGKTRIAQITEINENILFGENTKLLEFLKTKLSEASIPADIKLEIQNIVNGTDDSLKMEEESMRYFLWLNSERCSLFFADYVIICEGASEKIFVDYLFKSKWEDLRKRRIYLLDAGGKYNIHRYMNLFELLSIPHSILLDSDNDRKHQKYINEFIDSNKRPQTRSIHKFEPDFENFLAIAPVKRPDKKPLNVFQHFRNGKIADAKIDELKEIIKKISS